ncbi:MAG: glycosyltransferase, partial [Cyanobacteriota bacterium]|nr:glycosyltransferase [Cyanobacteriota bacterium]
MKKTVLIYRDQLLPYSETFIPAQVESFASYQGFYAGSSYLPETESMLPRKNCLVLDDEKPLPGLWKTAYKLAGVLHPNWVRRIENLSPSLIHAHFGLDGVLALPLARKLNLPLVVTFHGYYATAEIEIGEKKWYDYGQDFLKRRGQFFRELYARKREILFREADCVIAVSEFIRSQLLEKGCLSEKIRVCYIGIDLDKFVPDAT